MRVLEGDIRRFPIRIHDDKAKALCTAPARHHPHDVLLGVLDPSRAVLRHAGEDDPRIAQDPEGYPVAEYAAVPDKGEDKQGLFRRRIRGNADHSCLVSITHSGKRHIHALAGGGDPLAQVRAVLLMTLHDFNDPGPYRHSVCAPTNAVPEVLVYLHPVELLLFFLFLFLAAAFFPVLSAQGYCARDHCACHAYGDLHRRAGVAAISPLVISAGRQLRRLHDPAPDRSAFVLSGVGRGCLRHSLCAFIHRKHIVDLYFSGGIVIHAAYIDLCNVIGDNIIRFLNTCESF